MTTPVNLPPPLVNAATLDVTASFAQTDGASVTPGCEFGHRSEGTYVCPGSTASLAFFGSSVEIFLNGTTQCLVYGFTVLLDGTDVLAPQSTPACPNATHFQQSALSPASPHLLAVVNGASNTAPLLITRAFVDDYSPVAIGTTSSSATARPAPSTDSGPVEGVSSGRLSSRNLVAVLVPTLVIPILIIALAIGVLIPWWRRRRRRQRALMAPSAAFRAENPGLLAASPGAGEPLVPWTPIDAKSGPGETANLS